MRKQELIEHAEAQYRNNDVPDEVLDMLPEMKVIGSYHDKCVPMAAMFEAGRQSMIKDGIDSLTKQSTIKEQS